jgi:uncharacterized protein (TIGR03067 family)
MRFVALMTALSAGLLLAAEGPQEDAAQQELKKLQGRWSRVSAVTNGRPAPEETVKQSTLTIAGDKYTLKMGDQTRQGTLKLDPTKQPKAIDIISAQGPNKGKSLLGIYELEGDTFRYCVAEPGKERPTEFASKPGGGHSLFVNKREKP